MNGSWIFAAVLCLPCAAHAQAVADIIIRRGNVYDGMGTLPRIADVAIRGDRIVLVGDASRWSAVRDIDARGMIVSPGFIDPHMHAVGDLTSRNRDTRQASYALMQGITTVITGNDGQGDPGVANLLAGFRRDSIGINTALLVGHGTVRSVVMGLAARTPTATELERMMSLVEHAMQDGAFGLSSGLYYAPGSFAQTDEVISLARVVARFDGIYDSHTRDESSYSIGLLASIAEAIDVGRQAQVPVNISHIKALGVDVWGKAGEVIAMIRAARTEGVSVTADQYPWTASGTSVSAALLPRWAEAGGRDSLLARLEVAQTRRRITLEMADNMRRRGGAETLLLTAASGPAEFRAAVTGRTLEEYARLTGLDPVEAAIGIIRTGGASVASFNMNERDIEAFMREPFVMTSTDGSEGHPRKYATYPRKIRRYVLDNPVITMSRMIEASSAQVAETFRIADRGVLRDGYFADVIVFDPNDLREVATYQQPQRLADGMRWVLVNGIVVVADGVLTNELAGRGLSRRERNVRVGVR